MTTQLVTGPDRFIDDATLDGMHEAAVEMLTKTGMLVEHAEVRTEIAERDGFTLKDGRVIVPQKRIEALVAKMRESAAELPPRDANVKPSLGVDTRASFIVGKDGKTVRRFKAARYAANSCRCRRTSTPSTSLIIAAAASAAIW